MHIQEIEQPIPFYKLENDPIIGGKLFSMINFEGMLTHESELLIPHRNDFYLLVFARRGNGARHWVDMTPYHFREKSFYVFVPNQLIVKEEPKPIWGTAMAFTKEFLTLQQNTSLTRLPLIQNPANAHEILLNDQDIEFMEDILGRIYKEHTSTGSWHQQMLSAYLSVLLTYLSRLYTEQFESEPASVDKNLLKRFQEAIESHFPAMHQVSEYASVLNMSAGHLSEVVKAQSGRPAITHIHERLVLEARRMLFHTQRSLKDITYDLGFSDVSYFIRFFKRETGQTPAAYRMSIREMYH